MAVVMVTGAHLRQQVSEGETSTASAAPHPPFSKPELRATALARRLGASPALGMRLAGHVLALGAVRPGAVVAGYWPMRGEIDVRPLLLALLGRGHAVLLPETPPPGHPLVFRHWRPGVAMLPGRYGTVSPDGAIARPHLLLVPVVAFDGQCRRLGYGGGYYDRTIPGLDHVQTIGCAFEEQRVDQVPVTAHDVPLDAIATECGIIQRSAA